MSFPTVNGMLNENEETSRCPMAVKRGRCSDCALRAMILRNEAEVGVTDETRRHLRKRKTGENEKVYSDVSVSMRSDSEWASLSRRSGCALLLAPRHTSDTYGGTLCSLELTERA